MIAPSWQVSYDSLLPGFMLFGAGAGLMNVPLTNAVMHAVPADRSGVAAALLNASREVAGLLGITVIGAVLADPAGRRAPGRSRSRTRVRGRLPHRVARHDRAARGRRGGQLRDPAPAPGRGGQAGGAPAGRDAGRASAAVGELTVGDELAGEMMVTDDVAS